MWVRLLKYVVTKVCGNSLTRQKAVTIMARWMETHNCFKYQNVQVYFEAKDGSTSVYIVFFEYQSCNSFKQQTCFNITLRKFICKTQVLRLSCFRVLGFWQPGGSLRVQKRIFEKQVNDWILRKFTWKTHVLRLSCFRVRLGFWQPGGSLRIQKYNFEKQMNDWILKCMRMCQTMQNHM